MIKRKEENVTVMLLWTSNSVMAWNQTAHMFYLSRNFDNCNEKSNAKIVLSFTTKQKVLCKLKAWSIKKECNTEILYCTL